MIEGFNWLQKAKNGKNFGNNNTVPYSSCATSKFEPSIIEEKEYHNNTVVHKTLVISRSPSGLCLSKIALDELSKLKKIDTYKLEQMIMMGRLKRDDIDLIKVINLLGSDTTSGHSDGIKQNLLLLKFSYILNIESYIINNHKGYEEIIIKNNKLNQSFIVLENGDRMLITPLIYDLLGSVIIDYDSSLTSTGEE